MSEATVQEAVSPVKRVILFLAAVMAAATMFFAVNTSSAHAASENFCSGAWLNPYGWSGDRCWAPGHTTLWAASIVTNERAGCVDIANGANELMFAWVCGGNWSSPAAAATIYDFNHEGVFRKGVIRNNNTNQGGYFWGSQSY